MRILILLVFFLSCFSDNKPPTKKDWLEFSRIETNRILIEEFENFLIQEGASNIIPTEEIFRQGTDWKRFYSSAFIIPPKPLWKKIIPTLKFIKLVLEPKIGKVEVLSSYRTRTYNFLARGASSSRHLHFSAFDLIPHKKYTRENLHKALNEIWLEEGKKHKIGLGLYSGLRFHIDTMGYRKW